MWLWPLIPWSAIFSVSLTLLTRLNHSLLHSPLLQPHWLGCWAHSFTKFQPRTYLWPALLVPCSPPDITDPLPASLGPLQKRTFLTSSPTTFSVTCCPITQDCLLSAFSSDTVLLMWVLYHPHKIYVWWDEVFYLILIPLHLKQCLAHGEGKVAAELITQSIQYQITASLERKRKYASVHVGLLIPNLKHDCFTNPCCSRQHIKLKHQPSLSRPLSMSPYSQHSQMVEGTVSLVEPRPLVKLEVFNVLHHLDSGNSNFNKSLILNDTTL